jgi:hypothetical protein
METMGIVCPLVPKIYDVRDFSIKPIKTIIFVYF